jgi:hypothetical protein
VESFPKREDSFCSISTLNDPFEPDRHKRKGVSRLEEQQVKAESPLSYWEARKQRKSFEMERLQDLDDEMMQECSSKNLKFQMMISSGSADAQGPYEPQSLSMMASPGDFERDNKYALKLDQFDKPE